MDIFMPVRPEICIIAEVLEGKFSMIFKLCSSVSICLVICLSAKHTELKCQAHIFTLTASLTTILGKSMF